MKISKLIEYLEFMQAKHGDLTVATQDGKVRSVKGFPCLDGVYLEAGGVVPEPNEIVLEFQREEN